MNAIMIKNTADSALIFVVVRESSYSIPAAKIKTVEKSRKLQIAIRKLLVSE